MHSLIRTTTIFLIGMFLLVFPSFFSHSFTEGFVLAKVFLLGTVVLLATMLLVILAIKDRISFRQTSFSLPVAIFLLGLLLSCIVSITITDSLIAYFPYLFAGLLYYCLTISISTEREILFLNLMLIVGASVSSLLTVLSFFRLVPLSLQSSTVFTPFGSHLDHLIFTSTVLLFITFLIFPTVTRYLYLTSKDIPKTAKKLSSAIRQNTLLQIILICCSFLLITGISIHSYMVFVKEKPLILPVRSGIAVAISAVNDQQRIIRQLTLGSGVGTYLQQFTKYKPISLNNDSKLWNVPFSQSSSFLLELMTTTGILGILSYFFLIKSAVKKNLSFLPVTFLIILSFFLPLSITIHIFLFILLAFFALLHDGPNILPSTIQKRDQIIYKEYQKHPIIARMTAILSLLILLIIGYFLISFISSDLLMQESFDLLRVNNLAGSYNKQNQAISIFPYEDGYYRAFSQTNLAVSAALIKSNKLGSDQKARDTLQLYLQQSIASGKKAAYLSKETGTNWNNLASIYTSLIGVGRGAEEYAVLAAKKAVSLDPTNPRQYINLGGLYYRLGQYKASEREYLKAVRLKNDLANAYYNLFFALKGQGKLNQAREVLLEAQKHTSPTSPSYQILQQELVNLRQNEEKTGQNEVLQPEEPIGLNQVATTSAKKLPIQGLE